MMLNIFLRVCTVVSLVYITTVSAQTPVRCRICNAARSLDDCFRSVTCAPDEECFMDEVVTEQLTIEFTSGCRARDVCSSASSSGNPIGKRGINKRAGFIACSRCCDTASSNGKECNTKLCGIKLNNQNSSQCYHCDSTRPGGQGDVPTPSQCGTLTTCQTDEVCGAETFALATNVTHRKTCLPRRLCTLLTQKALEDIKRCKDPASIAAGACGNRKRSGNMVCSACCGDAVCNGDSCEDVLERLYNLWMSNVLDFHTLTATRQVYRPTFLTSPLMSTVSSSPAARVTAGSKTGVPSGSHSNFSILVSTITIKKLNTSFPATRTSTVRRKSTLKNTSSTRSQIPSSPALVSPRATTTSTEVTSASHKMTSVNWKATLQSTKITASSAEATTQGTTLMTKATAPSTRATISSAKATTPTTSVTTVTSKATLPSSKILTFSTKVTPMTSVTMGKTKVPMPSTRVTTTSTKAAITSTQVSTTSSKIITRTTTASASPIKVTSHIKVTTIPTAVANISNKIPVSLNTTFITPPLYPKPPALLPAKPRSSKSPTYTRTSKTTRVLFTASPKTDTQNKSTTTNIVSIKATHRNKVLIKSFAMKLSDKDTSSSVESLKRTDSTTGRTDIVPPTVINLTPTAMYHSTVSTLKGGKSTNLRTISTLPSTGSSSNGVAIIG